MDGVVKDPPEPRLAPPEDAAYQLIVPPEAIAERATVPVPHRLPPVEPVILGVIFIVAKTAVLEAEVHPLAVAST